MNLINQSPAGRRLGLRSAAALLRDVALLSELGA